MYAIKKPIPIEYFRFGDKNPPEWFMKEIRIGNVIIIPSYEDQQYCLIHTLEGCVRCNIGEYIIRGIDGELYPCNSSIFDRSYIRIGGIMQWLLNKLFKKMRNK